MNHVSVEHLELVMQGMNNLRLRDTRTLYSILRKYSQNGKKDRDLATAFIPKYGVVTGEIGLAYIVNQPPRNK